MSDRTDRRAWQITAAGVLGVACTAATIGALVGGSWGRVSAWAVAAGVCFAVAIILGVSNVR